MPERPFVLVGQQYLADPQRSVGDVHPVWTYAHVPNGYTGDATEAIIAQIERFAPGFRDRIIGHTVRSTTQMAAYNPNFVGGDIITGAKDIRQLIFGPRITLSPYRVRRPRHVHLLGGHAAGPGRARDVRNQRRPDRTHRTQPLINHNPTRRPMNTAIDSSFDLFSLTDEHEELRAAIRALSEKRDRAARGRCRRERRVPRAKRWTRWSSRPPRGAHPRGLRRPGADAVATCIVIEEVARVCASSSLIPAVNKLGTMADPAPAPRS